MNATAIIRHRGQAGFALFVGLVLLIVLSIIALVAMQLVANQNRLASAAWAAQMGLTTSEGALINGQNQVLNGAVLNGFSLNTNGTYTFNWSSLPQWAQPAFSWIGSGILPSGSYTNSAYSQSTAQVIIEQLPSVAAPGQSFCSSSYGCNGGILQVFRVTANGVGPDGTTPVLLQDTSVQ